MTSANVELVRSIFAASYERGDFLAALAWAHPEIEFLMVGGPEPGSWKGLAEVESFLGDYLSAWDGSAPRRTSSARLMASVYWW